MKRTLAAVLLFATLVVAGVAHAAREVTLHGPDAALTAVGTPERTAGYSILRLQVCGTGFSGTVTVLQGAKRTTVTTTKTLTLTTVSDCTEYYSLNPSAWTRVDQTRSAGTVTIYLEEAP